MTGVLITSLRVFGHTESFGLVSNSHSFLPLTRLVAAHPAVALRVHDLAHAADVADRGRRPLAVQDVLADRVVFPRSLPLSTSIAMIDGAFGDGTLTWLSSWPLPVLQ